MADLDTALKRGSGIHVGCPWRTYLPFPDGTISSIDRPTLVFLYSFAAAVPNSGGWPIRTEPFFWPKAPSRKEIADAIARGREKFGIAPAVSRVVEKVARTHVETLESSPEQIAADLVSSIEAANLEYDVAQLQFHDFVRSKLMEREIAQRIVRQMTDEESAIILLLLAM